ncbi:TPA: DUF645 family protein [Vibrio cholerae]
MLSSQLLALDVCLRDAFA